jgi:hypothetical protein
MAERRSTRTKRRPDNDEPAEVADDELAEEPEDEFEEEPEDELEGEPGEAEEEPEDELGGEPGEAEEDSGQDRGKGGRAPRRRPRRPRSGGLTAARAGQAARRQITELTGKDPEGVTGVEPGEDGGWVVGVEVVEDRRIPSSTDILATYEIELDPDGDLMSYRRVRRYPRGRGDDGDS